MSEQKQDAVLILLGELKGKMDSFMIAHTSLESRVSEHDKEISELKSSKAWVLGAAAAISGLLVAASQLLIRLFHNPGV